MNPNIIPYTPQEDELIAEMMTAGAKWIEVSRATGRTEEAIKARWFRLRKLAAMTDSEQKFRQAWIAAYGYRGYPRYKVDQLDAPPMMRAFGADRMTTGGVAPY